MAQRGYILLEAMIGGALVSTVLLSLFGHVGEAQVESTRQSRMITAEQIALRDIEEVRSLPFGTAANTSIRDRSVAVPMPNNGSYLLERTVSAEQIEKVKTSQDVSIVYRDITVRVSFPDRVGRRAVTTTTRMYRE